MKGSIIIFKVGIIANPNSGTDIRRLVGYESVFDNVEKTIIIQKILIGLEAMDVKEILFMPENYNFFDRAIEGLSKNDRKKLIAKTIKLDLAISGTEKDSTIAGTVMHDQGVDCIIVLGGDGTSRAVAIGCKNTPLLPISTGTNNVFPYKLEGTVAGLVAGIYSSNKFQKNLLLRKPKYLKLYINGKFKNIALVDLAVCDDSSISTKALWKPEKINFIAATRADIGSIGLTSILSSYKIVNPEDNHGLYCYLDKKKPEFIVKAILAPGLICDVPVKNYKFFKLNERVDINIVCRNKWSTITLDGEKMYEVNIKYDKLEFELKIGNLCVLNPKIILQEAVNKGLLMKYLAC